MVQEFIENFLYQNSPQPKGFYGQFPMSEGFKSELGLSKKFPYEGFSTKYQGPDKTGLTDYAKKGLRSIFSNVPETGIGGGTAGQRIIYENLINNPILRNIFNMGGRALQFGSKALGPFSLFMPSRELGSGELPQELFDQQMQQAIRRKQEETQQKIIDEVKESGGGGGPAGMVGTPSGPGQTGGPAGMGSAPKRRSKPDLRRRATGGLVELEGDTRQLFPVEVGGGLTRRGGPNRIPELLSAPGIIARPGPILNRPPGFGNFIGIQPMPPLLGVQPSMPDYSGQFEKLGEQLGGFGKQLDALGSFNEQVGGLGKQFEAVNNKLDSLEKGLGSLGNQLASFENMQKAQPQEVTQPRRPSINPFGLANLFMNMRRF